MADPDRFVASPGESAPDEMPWLLRTAGGVGVAALLGLATLPWVLGPAIAVLPGLGGYVLGLPLAWLGERRRPAPPGKAPLARFTAIGMLVALVAAVLFVAGVNDTWDYLVIALMIAAPVGAAGGVVVAWASTAASRVALLTAAIFGAVTTVIVTAAVAVRW